MSKYRDRGAYHYTLFKTPGDPYRMHVLDVLQHVKKHVRTQGTLLDVGCGEGLVLRKLIEDGYQPIGCEIDEHAIAVGKEKGNPIATGTIDQFKFQHFDCVLMLDVLEHVEDLHGTLVAASDLAPLVMVAVPDRNDPHACRQGCEIDIAVFFDDKGWECLHTETRHARHFMIFKHKEDQVNAGAFVESDTVPESPRGFTTW